MYFNTTWLLITLISFCKLLSLVQVGNSARVQGAGAIVVFDHFNYGGGDKRVHYITGRWTTFGLANNFGVSSFKFTSSDGRTVPCVQLCTTEYILDCSSPENHARFYTNVSNLASEYNDVFKAVRACPRS